MTTLLVAGGDAMTHERHVFGLVAVVGTDGRLTAIEDEEGTHWLEIDRHCDLHEIPAHLHADVQRALEWAIEENKQRTRDDAAESARNKDLELAEWNQHYNTTRGV